MASWATLRETILAGPWKTASGMISRQDAKAPRYPRAAGNGIQKRDRRRTGSFHEDGNKSVGRRSIKRGPGKRQMEGKAFPLAEEIQYIQRRAAEPDGRFVTVGAPWRCSPPKPVTPGCWTGKTVWLFHWRGTAVQRTSTLRKPTSALPSAGKETTELKTAPSSTLTRTQAASSRFSAILPAASRNGADREISNMFG